MQIDDVASEGSVAALTQRLEQTGTAYVRCQFIDYIGLARGREVSAEYLQRYSERGVAIAPVNYTWDIEDLNYDLRYGPEAGDVFLVADPSSFVALPYLKGNGHVFCDVVTADGNPWPGCTRQLLKRIVAQAQQELGTASMGFEQEGFLLKRDANGYRPGTGDRDGLTDRARHFIGGLLAHAPALVALGCPSVNSYKRLRPGLFAPTHAAYGIGNRSAMIRVLRTRTGSGADPGQRIELRTADGTCNPHLLAAAVLVAGLDGVRRSIDPGAPIAEDVGNLPAPVLAKAGIRQLPVNLSEALDGLEADATFSEAFGNEVIAGFLRVKRLEWSKYSAHVSDWEYGR